MGRFAAIMAESRAPRTVKGTWEPRDTEDPTYIDIECIEHETDDAVLLSASLEKIWVPKSVLQFASERDELAAVAPWFADKRGL